MPKFKFVGGMFGEDVGTALKYDFVDWNVDESGSGSDGSAFGIPDVANLTGTISASYALAFRLLGTARLDLGSLESSFSFDSNAVLSPKNAMPNSDAFIDTSGFTSTDLEHRGLDATGPDAAGTFIKLQLGGGFEGHLDASVGYNYDIFVDSGADSSSIIDTDVDIDIPTQDIFKITAKDLGGLDGDLYTLDFGFGSLTASLPEFDYDDVTLIDDGSQFGSLHMTGKSSPFLTAEIDLDSFLRIPVSLEKELPLGPASFGIDAGIFDAKLVGTASLSQDITYTPDVDVTMKTSLGQTIKGDLGDKFEFDTPEGEGKFTVDATYAMSVTLKAITSLIFEASFDWKIAYGNLSASFNLGIYNDSWSEGFTALEGSEAIGDGLGVEIMNDISVYELGKSHETFTLSYENFVTKASGRNLELTTHQVWVHGGDIKNNIIGNALANQLSGHGGDDYISGGRGRDNINGGTGNDVLTGGKGSDTFVFDVREKNFSDTIMDLNFKHGDIIDLSEIDANTQAKNNQAFIFIESHEFTGRAGQLRFEEKHGDTILMGDWNGDGKSDFSIVIDGGTKFIDSQMML